MRRALLGLMGAVALGSVGVLLAGFVWPSVSSEVELGRVEAFPRGSFTSFYRQHGAEDFRRLESEEVVGMSCGGIAGAYIGGSAGIVIHVVRLEDGSFLAHSGRSTHLGRMVVWLPDRQYEGADGVFEEPCHGEKWTMDGTRIFGPAPRDLDRFGLRIEDDRVIVDTNDVTEGERR